VGLAALSLGTAMVIGGLVQGSAAPAFANTQAYELYCPGTPVGKIVLNNVVTTGKITPASPNAGGNFNLTDYQTTVNLPAPIVTDLAALGNSAIVGTATEDIDAFGATPERISGGSLTIDTPIPSPVPAMGLTLTLPSAPSTVGPFTAAAGGGAITLTVDPTVSLILTVSGTNLAVTCNTYPNNTVATGFVTTAPSGAEASPILATATAGSGSTTSLPPPGTTDLTGPYELYCPGTPVGNLAMNNVVTTGTISPAPSVGQTFDLTDYQTMVTLPTQIVTAAAALGNSAIVGTAAVQIDATGATPSRISAGPLTIDTPIPSPVPRTGLTLNLPNTPSTIGPFTASGGTITLTVDPTVLLTLTVSGSNLPLVCHPYPNNAVATGIVTTAPSGAEVYPVIVTATAKAPATAPSGGNASEPIASYTTTFTSSRTGSSGQTPRFLEQGPWALGWSYQCPSTGNFIVDVNQPSDDLTSDIGPNELGTNGAGIDYYTDSGIFSLSVITAGCTWTLNVDGSLPTPVSGMAAAPWGNGYWLTDAGGGVNPHGGAENYGSMALQHLNAPVTHIVSTRDGQGYWLVASDGGTFAFGDAPFYGSMGGQHLNAPVVDIAPTLDGQGYWLVASDGGVFAFGDAGFYGSMGGRHVNKPIIGVAPDYETGGYWLVASDGGVFAFNAPFLGSMGGTRLAQPVNGMAATPDGDGYWMVASDGGLFSFGDARFHGSMGGQAISAPIVGMTTDLLTGGYWLVGADGSIFAFNAPYFGAD